MRPSIETVHPILQSSFRHRSLWRRIRRGLYWAVGLTLALYAGTSAFVGWRYTAGSSWKVPAPAPDSPLHRQLSEVSLRSTDGTRLAGWLIKPKDDVRSEKGVVLLHGRTGDRSSVLDRAEIYHQAGFHVLMIDARGHGESGMGKCSLGWWDREDALTAVRFLEGEGCHRIIGHGISQGAATWLMGSEKWPPYLVGIVAESSFASAREAIRRRFPIKFGLPPWIGDPVLLPVGEWNLGVCTEEVSPEKLCGGICCPVFLLTGSDDSRAPASDSQRIAQGLKVPTQPWIVPRVGHTNLRHPDPKEYDRRLRDFWRRCEL